MDISTSIIAYLSDHYAAFTRKEIRPYFKIVIPSHFALRLVNFESGGSGAFFGCLWQRREEHDAPHRRDSSPDLLRIVPARRHIARGIVIFHMATLFPNSPWQFLAVYGQHPPIELWLNTRSCNSTREQFWQRGFSPLVEPSSLRTGYSFYILRLFHCLRHDRPYYKAVTSLLLFGSIHAITQ
jgi:hypothetical protein